MISLNSTALTLDASHDSVRSLMHSFIAFLRKHIKDGVQSKSKRATLDLVMCCCFTQM